MKVIKALLWIWPLPYELSTEQLKWKWESAHNLPQGHFYYFHAEERKRRKIQRWLSNSLTWCQTVDMPTLHKFSGKSIWGWRCDFIHFMNGYVYQTNIMHISVCPINQKVRWQHIRLNRAVSGLSKVNGARSRTSLWSVLVSPPRAV